MIACTNPAEVGTVGSCQQQLRLLYLTTIHSEQRESSAKDTEHALRRCKVKQLTQSSKSCCLPGRDHLPIGIAAVRTSPETNSLLGVEPVKMAEDM